MRSGGQNGETYVNISLDAHIKEKFINYLNICACDFLNRLQSIDDLEAFREDMRRVVTGKSQKFFC